jgi:SAM-dependent methyltransferase
LAYGKRAGGQYDAMAAAYDGRGPYNELYERPATIALLGDVAGRRVLEVGSGPGVLTGWLVDHGAAVVAIDASAEMVKVARRRVGDRAKILVADMTEPLDFAVDGSVDVVVASLVLHYAADWAPVLSEFNRVLAADGVVVFSVHHPAMDWARHSPDDYFALKEVTETWSMDGQSFEVTFWRRPLRAVTDAIEAAGFVIDRLAEPEPAASLRERDPEADREIRTRPTFLFFRLRKR